MRLPRLTTRRLMVLVAVVGVCLCFLDCRGVVWDGGFPLQVDLQDRGSRTIVGVAVQTCSNARESEFFLAHPDSPELDLRAVPWRVGQPFTVHVPCGGRSSGLGRELDYGQYRTLLVRV